MAARHLSLSLLGLGLLLHASGAAAMDDRDRAYLRAQAQGSAYELGIARLAAEKSSPGALKEYARTVVSDHEQLDAELHQLADAKNVELPPGMTDRQQASLAQLSALGGTAFERAFKEETVRINAEDVKQDAAEVAATSDPDLRAFARKMQDADTRHDEAGRRL